MQALGYLPLLCDLPAAFRVCHQVCLRTILSYDRQLTTDKSGNRLGTEMFR